MKKSFYSLFSNSLSNTGYYKVYIFEDCLRFGKISWVFHQEEVPFAPNLMDLILNAVNYSWFHPRAKRKETKLDNMIQNCEKLNPKKKQFELMFIDIQSIVFRDIAGTSPILKIITKNKLTYEFRFEYDPVLTYNDIQMIFKEFEIKHVTYFW